MGASGRRVGQGGGRWAQRPVWKGVLVLAVVAPAVAVAAGSTAAAGGGSPVRAAGTQIACTSMAGSTTFSPGITGTSQSIEATSATGPQSPTLTGCSAASRPAIVSGTVAWSKVTGTAGCTTGNGSGTFTVTWKDASGGVVGTSTITGSAGFTIDPKGAIAVSGSGTVTAGLFSGGTALPVFLGVAADLTKCLTTGVTSASSGGSFAIA